MNGILIAVIVFTLLVKSFSDSRCEDSNQISCGETSENCYHPSWICDGEVDCPETGKDEMNCDTHTCEEGQFQCKMGHCIDGDRRCNHFEDCHDRSDEIDCDWTCEPSEFKCATTGRCLSYDLRCNGQYDCGGRLDESDESDEIDCKGPGHLCDDKQFYCHSSPLRRCINARWRCDGVGDCENGEDELDCKSRLSCQGGFLCDENTKCINVTQICDQRRDCDDGSDEDAETCFEECKPPQRWACGGGGYGYCIDYSAKCDGFYNCLDGSDEEDCVDTRCDGGFRCRTGACIPAEWRCDEHDDCRDGVQGGSDEANCDVCLPSQFMCDDKVCLDKTLLCDGKTDCPSGQDEEYCLGTGETCDSGYQCHTSKKCIPKWMFCNQQNDCGDNSDEIENCVPWDKCKENNGDCEHYCDPLPRGNRSCSCEPGYQLDTDLTSCVDVDECKNHTNAVCSQHCTNTEASYYCYCQTGYQLAGNNRSCLATTETEPYLVFSMVYKMKKSNLNGTISEVIFPTNHSNVIDYHYTQERWFWVSTVAKTTATGPNYNVFEHMVHSRRFNGSDIRRLYSDIYLEINDMVVDWVSGKVYIAGRNGSNGIIRVVDIATSNYTDIVSTRIKNPRSIVLDPAAGVMFWSDLDELEKGDIGRCDMDGENRLILANDVGWANGITVDYVRQKVVWIDAGSKDLESYAGRVEEMDYDGANRRIVTHLTPYASKPRSISMFEDYYYWADSKQEAIIKCNRFNTSKIEKVRTGLNLVMAVKVVHPLRQPASQNYCQNNTCSHVCLLKPGGFSCKCPQGLVLEENSTCVTPTYQVGCENCPEEHQCVSTNQLNVYECVPNDKYPDNNKNGKKNDTKSGSDRVRKVSGISWWICLIIVALAVIVVGLGIIGCKHSIRSACKPCVNRFMNRDGETRNRNNQDYMQISLQPTSTCTTGTLVTEVSECSQISRTKKESDI